MTMIGFCRVINVSFTDCNFPPRFLHSAHNIMLLNCKCQVTTRKGRMCAFKIDILVIAIFGNYFFEKSKKGKLSKKNG